MRRLETGLRLNGVVVDFPDVQSRRAKVPGELKVPGDFACSPSIDLWTDADMLALSPLRQLHGATSATSPSID